MSHRTNPFSFLFLIILLLHACGDPVPATNNGSSTTDTTTIADTPPEPTLEAPDCVIAGEVLEGNSNWNSSQDLLLVIKADSSTYAEGYGPSHRIFEILDGRSCETLFQQTLEENTSPDYPYYLADIQYNHASNFVGIQGYYDLYICDLANEYKLTQLSPEFFSERDYDDPQSGMIVRLEVWENFLFGFAQDCGPFAFDLSNREEPSVVLPFAEWLNGDISRYHSLFLLPSEGGGMQALMPYYDYEEEAFSITPLFQEPVTLSTNVPRNARNNRFLVLRGENDSSTIYPIDLGARALIDVPADVRNKDTQAILQWMRDQAI